MKTPSVPSRILFLACALLAAAPCGAATYEGRYQVANGDRFKVVVSFPDAPTRATVPLAVLRKSEPAHKVSVCDSQKEVGWGDGPIMECTASHLVNVPEYNECSQSFSYDFGRATIRVIALTPSGEKPYSENVVPLKFDVFAGYNSTVSAAKKDLCPSPSATTPVRIGTAGSVRQAVIKQNKGDRGNLVVDATFELRDLKARMIPASGGRAEIAFDGGAVKIGDFYTYSSGRLDASAVEVPSYDHFDNSNKVEFKPAH